MVTARTGKTAATGSNTLQSRPRESHGGRLKVRYASYRSAVEMVLTRCSSHCHSSAGVQAKLDKLREAIKEAEATLSAEMGYEGGSLNENYEV